MDFSERATGDEMIDDPGALSSRETRRVLVELKAVNRRLGGTRTVLNPLKTLTRELAAEGRPLRVLDVGAGGGDICKSYLRWAEKEGISARAIALDFSFSASQVANSQMPDLQAVCADALQPPVATNGVDIVICSAFLHHFGRDEIIQILREFRRMSRSALVLVDLQRSRLAWLGIRILTALFSRSRAVQHDGPLSVRKGFRREEIRELMEAAGYENVGVDWCWAFRLRITTEVITDSRLQIPD